MKKFMILLVMMVSVNVSNAQVVIRNNGSSVTISFNMIEYIDIPSEEIPYAQYLRPRTFFIAEVARLIPERFRYNAQYYSPMEAGQEMAMELAKFKMLKAKVAALKAGKSNGNTVSRDSNYEARKHADAKKAAQEYAAKRDSQRTAQPRTYSDSSRTTTTTTGSFASGL